MKVLHVIADGSPGGGTTNVLALTEDLLAAGISVAFCSEASSYTIEHARQLGAEVVDGLRFFRGRLNLSIVNKLREAADRAMPDIVHCHGARAALAWVRGCDRSQLSKSIYTVRGYQFWEKSQPMKALAMLSERWISSSVFRTVHVAQSDQDVASQHHLISNRAASVVIRNGIDMNSIPARQKDFTNLRKRVAVLGRITQPKNPHFVLDLAKILASDGYEFHFIGGGDQELEIRKRVVNEQITNVVVHGYQSRDDGLQLMSECGTFLLASIWEGLPVAPIEAMAMGLAVVISNVNGCPEVVRDGIDGRVAPSKNLAGFLAALRDVVTDPQRTSRMIESGKRRVATEFSRERVAAQHTALYRQCLATRGLVGGLAA